jgi:hypothetical protein
LPMGAAPDMTIRMDARSTAATRALLAISNAMGGTKVEQRRGRDQSLRPSCPRGGEEEPGRRGDRSAQFAATISDALPTDEDSSVGSWIRADAEGAAGRTF